MGSDEVDLHRFDLSLVQPDISEEAYPGVERVDRGYAAHCSVYPEARCLHSKESIGRNLNLLDSFSYGYNFFKRKRGAIEINHGLIVRKHDRYQNNVSIVSYGYFR